MKTKNGIELNLEESEYFIQINEFIFYFSSKFYLNKFKENYYIYSNFEEKKIENKYKIKIDLFYYLIFSLYKRIEKRGFCIKDISKNCYINENVIFSDLYYEVK